MRDHLQDEAAEEPRPEGGLRSETSGAPDGRWNQVPVEKKQVGKEKWHRSLMEMEEGDKEEEEEEVKMKWVDGTNCASCRKTKTKTPGLRH